MSLSWIESAVEVPKAAVVIAVNSHIRIGNGVAKDVGAVRQMVAIALGVTDTVLLAIVPCPPELKMAIEWLALTLHVGDGIVLEIERAVAVVVAVGVFNAAQVDVLDRHVLHGHAGVGGIW